MKDYTREGVIPAMPRYGKNTSKIVNASDEVDKHDDLSDDICKWSVRNACYTRSIKHYDTLPTPIVRTFSYCPYCGKKIKLLVDKNNMYLVENNDTKAEIIEVEVDQIE